jgi:hypothetical protein
MIQTGVFSNINTDIFLYLQTLGATYICSTGLGVMGLQNVIGFYCEQGMWIAKMYRLHRLMGYEEFDCRWPAQAPFICLEHLSLTDADI